MTNLSTNIAEESPTLRRGRPRVPSGAILGLLIPLALIALVALCAPLFPLPGPNVQSLQDRFIAPVWIDGDWAHPLGTDSLGRDVLSRLVFGARLSLLIGVLSVLVSGLIGVTLGITAGYRRGLTDAAISRLVDAQLALPFMLLALSIISSRGRSLLVLVLVLALAGWAQYARVMRAETMSLRERPFVLGLRAAGASPARIMSRHIFPNTLGSLIVIATLEVGAMITAEGALSFLGLGVVAPDVSWGLMLAEGREQLTNAWWVATFPGIAIAVVVLLTSLLGDALNTKFEQHSRGTGR